MIFILISCLCVHCHYFCLSTFLFFADKLCVCARCAECLELIERRPVGLLSMMDEEGKKMRIFVFHIAFDIIDSLVFYLFAVRFYI